MGAFDVYDQATGNIQETPIPSTSENCPNNNCAFWNVTECAFAECKYTVPEVVTKIIYRKCIICGKLFPTDAVGLVNIDPQCIADIRDAIAKKHNPGSDD